MPSSIAIHPVRQPIRAAVQPPGSKSITNRALVCAALSAGRSTLRGALDSEDTRVMIAGLRALGISVEASHQGETLIVTGCAGKPPAQEANIFVENSGTTIRFLTALSTLAEGCFTLDGIARMRQRPIGDLATALKQLGGEVTCTGDDRCPPVQIKANGLSGGIAHIQGNLSSQFLSGLLMAAPCARAAVEIKVDGPLVSVPYVGMTQRVMSAFGVDTHAADNFSTIEIPHYGSYRASDYSIEPDASAASYFWAAAAVTQGEVTVTGLSRNSLQGDVGFVDCLRQMGCQVRYDSDSVTVKGGPLRGIDIDMNAISDTVQTLSVVALFAKGTTRIHNVSHIRHKETDRIAAVVNELRKFGAEVVEFEDGLAVTPGKSGTLGLSGRLESGTLGDATLGDARPGGGTPVAIDTYNDHRMAMSFAIAGLRLANVTINEPDCTVKTYPRFFEDLAALSR